MAHDPDTLGAAAKLARLIRSSPVGQELGEMPEGFLTDPITRDGKLSTLSPEATRLLVALGAATYYGAMEVTQ
jgi:hypothetical protein